MTDYNRILTMSPTDVDSLAERILGLSPDDVDSMAGQQRIPNMLSADQVFSNSQGIPAPQPAYAQYLPNMKLKDNPLSQSIGFASQLPLQAMHGAAGGVMDVLGLAARATGVGGPVADKINRLQKELGQLDAEISGNGMAGLLNRNFQGAVRSLTTMIPAAATGGFMGVLATAMAVQGDEALTEAEDAGLKGLDKFRYAATSAAIEGSITALFQKLGIGGLEKGVIQGFREGVKSLGKDALAELTEENTIELLHSLNSHFSNVDPNALSKESLINTARDTTIQTLLAMGLARGIQGSQPRPASTVGNNVRSAQDDLLVKFAEENPDKASEIAAKDKPSRKDVAGTPFEFKNQERRTEAAQKLRDILHNPVKKQIEQILQGKQTYAIFRPTTNADFDQILNMVLSNPNLDASFKGGAEGMVIGVSTKELGPELQKIIEQVPTFKPKESEVIADEGQTQGKGKRKRQGQRVLTKEPDLPVSQEPDVNVEPDVEPSTTQAVPPLDVKYPLSDYSNDELSNKQEEVEGLLKSLPDSETKKIQYLDKLLGDIESENDRRNKLIRSDMPQKKKVVPPKRIGEKLDKPYAVLEELVKEPENLIPAKPEPVSKKDIDDFIQTHQSLDDLNDRAVPIWRIRMAMGIPRSKFDSILETLRLDNRLQLERRSTIDHLSREEIEGSGLWVNKEGKPTLFYTARLLESEPTAQTNTDADKLVYKSALKLGKGNYATRIYLSDLRKDIPELSRKELDELLLKMQREGKIVLYQLDFPPEITDERAKASINVAGENRHIVYVDPPSKATDARPIVEILNESPMDIQELQDSTGMSAEQVNQEIRNLKSKGWIEREPEGMKWRVSKKGRDEALQQTDIQDKELKEFSIKVFEASEKVPAEKHWEGWKIYISHAYEEFKKSNPGMSLSEFKNKVALANNKGYLALSHADLPSLMDQEALKASVTPWLNDEFHFIRIHDYGREKYNKVKKELGKKETSDSIESIEQQLNQLNTKNLRKMAKDMGIKGMGVKKKAAIVKAITDHMRKRGQSNIGNPLLNDQFIIGKPRHERGYKSENNQLVKTTIEIRNKTTRDYLIVLGTNYQDPQRYREGKPPLANDLMWSVVGEEISGVTGNTKRYTLASNMSKNQAIEYAKKELQKKTEEISDDEMDSILDALDEARTEADTAPTYENVLGIKPSNKKGKIRQGLNLPPTHTADPLDPTNPQAARRLGKSHGAPQPGLLQKAFQLAKTVKNQVTRAQEHIPKDPKFAVANNFFRKLKTIPQIAQDETNNTLAAITDRIKGTQEKKLFERFLIAENLLESVQRGEPLRFGFNSLAEVKDYVKQLEAIVKLNPEIQKALATRKKVINEFVDELKAWKLLGEDANREHYYHQQVIDRMKLNSFGEGTKPRPKTRSFQKQRAKGEKFFKEELDYNTDYLQAEAEWFHDAQIELRKAKLLAELKDHYANEYENNKDAYEWDEWQPKQGNYFYPAPTIPQKLAEELQRGIIDEAQLTKEQIKMVIAIGQQLPSMQLPVEVINQLDSMDKPKPSGPVAKFFQQLHKSWKVWTLLNPKTLTGYTLRNITGDVDAVIAGAPGAFNYAVKSIPEVWNYYQGKLALSEDIENARDLGVIGSSMTTEDIPQLKELEVFKRFYKKTGGSLINPFRAAIKLTGSYFNTVKKYSEFRESVLRYAAYRYYLDKLRNGTLRHYGGANKETVDALRDNLGNEDAAAYLSRNLLGDYGDLTVMGNWLRANLIPFWSWNEVNVKRNKNIMVNALKSAQSRTGGGVAATAAATVLSVPILMRLGALYATMYAWNHWMFPDEEEELAVYERDNPHIILGRNEDGTINILRNTGMLGDLFEWFGINTLVSLFPQWRNEQISGEDLIAEILKSPIRKVLGGLRPDLKLLYEIPAGKSSFPDPFNPQTKDRDELFFNMFGMTDYYKEVKGRITDSGERMRPHQLMRLLGVTDPRTNAISEMYDLRNKYLEKKGKNPVNFSGISPFKAIRESAYNQDYDAFLEARKRYIESNKNMENFLNSLDNLDPIANRLNDEDEREFEQEFLTSDQRKRLKFARDFAQDTRQRLWRWWNQAMQEDAPEQRQAFQAGVDKYYGSQMFKATDKNVEFPEQIIREMKRNQITLKQAEEYLAQDYANRYYDGNRSKLVRARNGRLTAYGERVKRLKQMYQ